MQVGSFILVVVGALIPEVTASWFQWDRGFQWKNIEQLLVFGDSYSFVFGTHGHPAFSFIGDYLPGNFSFTPEELLSNEIIQDFHGTSAGGPNWSEFLTNCAVQDGQYLPAECEDVELWNFAFAGADISETEYTPLHHPYTVPLVNQTQQYLTWAEPVLDMDKSRTLVAVWIGINDINDMSRFDDGDIDFNHVFDDAITTMFRDSVTPLYDAGFRRFLFLGLPPLDKTPGNVGRAPGETTPTGEHISWWDGILKWRAAEFGLRHWDATAMVYDARGFLEGVLAEPEAYGFANTTGYCAGYDDEKVLTDPGMFGCLPIDEYFWFNTGHITSHVHRLLAEDLAGWLEKQSKSWWHW